MIFTKKKIVLTIRIEPITNIMAVSFDTCISFALNKLKVNFNLKSKQVECLRSIYQKQSCVAVLPTGYGKSLIFQILPYFCQKQYKRLDPMIAIVVAPLNAIMEEQVLAMTSKGIMACFLSVSGNIGSTYEEGEPEGEEEEREEEKPLCLPKAVTLEDIKGGKFCIIYTHPEALHTKEVRKMLHMPLFQDRVCAIVVDEAHMITEWGEEFRPAFKKLGELTCIFPGCGHLALTATSTPTRIKELANILQYQNIHVVTVNPDRPNIYLEIQRRLPNIQKYEKYDELIKPVAEELCIKLKTFPVTIIYVESLESLGYYYRYLDNLLNDKQYVGDSIPENRLFAQYHKDYTVTMKRHIVSELTKDDPTVRLILATVALGMGLNSPSVTRIIHARPPTSLECYMQEIGRAGRKGQSATALMYFNNSDISRSRKGITDAVIEFCRKETCLRLCLMNYFGFEAVIFSGSPKDCCCNCKKKCLET